MIKIYANRLADGAALTLLNMHKLFASFTIFLLLMLGTSIAFLSHNASLHHPNVVFDAPDGLQITILQAGLSGLADCESVTASTVNLVQAACGPCRVKFRQCLEDLTADQKKLLSDAPLHLPSVRLQNGTVTYSSLDPSIALAACRESERLSSNGAGRLSCYPAGTARALPSARQMPTPVSPLLEPWIWVALDALGAILFTFLFLSGRAAKLVSEIVSWPRRKKQLVIVLADITAIEVTLWLALMLRLEQISAPHGDARILFFLGPVLAIPIFIWFGLYRWIIRYLDMQALLAIGKAIAVYGASLAIVVHLLGLEDVPWSALAIHPVLAALLIGALRAFARAVLGQSFLSYRSDVPRKNIVIYGAGSAGIQLAHALSHSRELKPVAYLDDDVRLHRTRLGSLEVYPPGSLKDLIERHDVREVLLAIPSTTRLRRKEIIDLLEPLPVQVRTLPGLSELAEGKIQTEDLREVEIEDILGRDPVKPDLRLMHEMISGRSIMVTGAGGSIGSELCRQIATLQPVCLILFEQSEYALYRIEQELIQPSRVRAAPFSKTRVVPLLGSVTDQGRLERAIKAYGVNTIFHAAAYKHVPMVERNPCEGVFNNIFGTYRASQAAINQGVECFVLISTDKAVRPTNTMGASKRFSEMILQSFSQSMPPGPDRPLFSIVRFGNVLGSSGSVLPLFREQIKRGGPLTVTDPRIIRYFMTIPEATQLVIQAGAMGTGGDVFVLDMGSPVKILDLAKRMIRLSGLHEKTSDNPMGDIEIVFSGLRRGEKLYEELLIGDNVSATAHPRILRAEEKTLSCDVVKQYMSRFGTMLESGDSGGIRQLLLESIEEFQPECGDEDLLHTHLMIKNPTSK